MVSSAAASCPQPPVQELRDLTRTRKQLVREITQHTLRIQKTLETANLELAGLLSNILGVSGFDMTRFPTAGHLVSWAGLGPRLDESAGKRLSTRPRPNNPWLKTTLVQAACAAARTKLLLTPIVPAS